MYWRSSTLCSIRQTIQQRSANRCPDHKQSKRRLCLTRLGEANFSGWASTSKNRRTKSTGCNQIGIISRNGKYSTLRRSGRTAHDNRSTTIFTVWPVDQLTFGRSGKPGEFRGSSWPTSCKMCSNGVLERQIFAPVPRRRLNVLKFPFRELTPTSTGSYKLMITTAMIEWAVLS